MLLDNRPYTFDRVVRLALGLAVCAGLLLLLAYLSEVLVPFAVAFLLAYLLNPVVSKLQDWGIRSRLAAVLLTLLLVGCALGAVGWLIVPMIGEQVRHLGALIGQLVSDQKIGAAIAQHIPAETWQHIRETLKTSQLQEYLQSDSFLDLLKGAATKIIPIGRGIFSGVVSTIFMLMGLMVILLYTVFLMLDFQKVRKDWQCLIPTEYRSYVVAFVQDFDDGMNRYFRAQATISCIIGAIYAIGFQIIGLPMGILLGMLIAALGMVPYLRTLSVVPALLLALIKVLDTGQSVWMVLLAVAIVYAVAEATDSAFLTPRIMGGVTGLSPALIILSLSVWGKLLGLLGLLIALPMTCLLLAYYRRLLAARTAPDAAGAPPGEGGAPQAAEAALASATSAQAAASAASGVSGETLSPSEQPSAPAGQQQRSSPL